MDYMTALTALRDQLTTDDCPATLNRQTLNPPGLLITLRGFDQWTMCGTQAEAAVNLFLVIGDRNDEAALLGLEPHLNTLLSLMGELNLPVEAVEAEQVQLTDSEVAMPAFRIGTHLTT